MTNLSTIASVPQRLLASAALLILLPTGSLAAPKGGGAVATASADGKEGADKPWSASLTVETSIGIGTFVSDPQNQSAVSTTFAPSASYKLADKLSLTGSFSLTWFQILDFGTPLKEHEVLLSDINIGISHGSIWKHKGSGFKLSGSISVSLPTSLASQFQNRLFTIKPSLRASIPVGPVTFGYTFGFGKFFNLSATPSINCDDFDNPSECIDGRENNPDFGFESERRGAEVYLPGAGTSSFYFKNGLSVRWAIIEGLALNLGVTVFNNFGVRSQPADEFTNTNATAGRSQTDRLISSLSLSYQILKEISVGTSLVTATGRPFGADGNDLVLFDFSRAPDNITSWNISVTGSL